MEDDNRLDLTLSLPCGGPSSGAKGKNGNGAEEQGGDNRGNKLIDDFKNFLDGSNHNKEESSNVGPKTEENLFYDLSKGNTNAETSSSKVVAEEKRQLDSSSNNKRKNMFDESTLHQKYVSGKARAPQVAAAADEGSTAENEDVADSETESVKEARGVSDSGGERRFNGGYSGQSVNILNMPYPLSVKETNSTLSENMGGNHQQPVIPANMPLMFGYSHVQLANVEGGGGGGGNSSQFHPSYFGRGPQNSSRQNDGSKTTQATTTTPVNTPKPFERAKGEDKHAKEEGSSMQAETETKGNNVIDHSRSSTAIVVESLPSEYPDIRPGILAELKFGGSGSSPNLPWVSTTGPGPNGRTISGVTYRYSGTQIRIVCACHGSHMSPEEFVQHASDEQTNPPNGGPGLPSCSNGNPAASAHD